MNVKDPIVILDAVRTPIGSYQGSLSRLSSVELGSVATRALLSVTNLKPEQVQEIIMGCVLPAGLGQAPARQVALKSGLSNHIKATTVNKVCGSGMQALVFAANQLTVTPASLIFAGGMESMSNAPLLKRRPPKGEEASAEHYADHLFLDGLQDAYEPGKLMGAFAEESATHYRFTRAEQDAYAVLSVERAKEATEKGWFEREIVPITLKTPQGTVDITTDGTLERANVEKIPHLKPAFSPTGTITAASSSSISDGASILAVTTQSHAKSLNITPRFKIVAITHYAAEPRWFTTAPLYTIQMIQKETGWSLEEVDAFEINEAFAIVAMISMKELGIPQNKINLHGGACALGHPIGASGARIITTLMNVLDRINGRRGIASICIGGGEALAVAIERV